MTLEIASFLDACFNSMGLTELGKQSSPYQNSMEAQPLKIQDDKIFGVWIWSRGGNGHKAAKDANLFQTQKECKKLNKELVALDFDMMGKGFLGDTELPFIGNFGDYCVTLWNEAQQKGDVAKQKDLVASQSTAEFIFGSTVYDRTKAVFEDLPIEPKYVISTQALCTKAILTAIQKVNYERNWNMKLKLFMTDMPTPLAIHFFNSLKIIGEDEELKNLIVLYAPKPLTKEKTPLAEAAFWKKYCGEIQVITDGPYPIREAFLNTEELSKKLSGKTSQISLKINKGDSEEIFKIGTNPNTKMKIEQNKVHYEINVEDKLAFLMLGSQPTESAVTEWVNTMAKFAAKKKNEKGNDSQKQYYFFVFCGAPNDPNDPTKDNKLLKKVTEQIKNLKLPDNFNIIPFTYQNAEELALLMARADLTITRAGGSTSMELIHLLAEKNTIPKRIDRITLIHSEKISETEPMSPKQIQELIKQEVVKLKSKSKYKHISIEELYKKAVSKLLIKHGIPLWEAGNAKYLVEAINAEIGNAEYNTDRIQKQFFEISL